MVELSEKLVEWVRHLLCQPELNHLPLGLEKGDVVHVRSDPKSRWHEDGVVQDATTKDLVVKGTAVPAGSLKVEFDRGSGVKWIKPEEARQMLRKVPRPQPRTVAAAAEAAKEPGSADMLRELGQVKQACRLGGHCFTDATFQLSLNSKVTAVLRPQQIARHEGRPPTPDWRLFRGMPCADDVQQGELGDCWFLSSLAALAEFQEGRFVHALLPGQEALSATGAYLVRLCLGGRWRGVVVDDKFPCIGGGMYYTQLAYCVTKRQQLWASVIEKGFAKVCGCYEAIRGGEATEALEMLTGWPCTMLILGQPDFDPELLWAALCSSRDAAFLMTCSTKKVNNQSLESDHVYSLMDVQEVTDAKGNLVRLLKIRNPHARSKWEGAWSDSSHLWTPQLRQELGCPEGGNPQVFFMPFEDFLREFAHCTICRIRSSEWHEAREPVRLPGGGEVPCVGVEVEAFEVTECCISLVQPGVRMRDGPFQPRLEGPLASMGFVLLPLQSPGKGPPAAVAAAQLRHAATVSCDCWLQVGRYMLVPLSMHRGPALDATWAFVSSRRVKLKERTLDAHALRHAWAAYVRDSDPRGVSFHGATLRFGKSDSGTVVATAENLSDRYVQFSLAFRSEFLRFSRGTAEVADWLPPSYAQVLQLGQTSGTEDKPVTWKETHTFQMTLQGPNAPWHVPPLAQSGTAVELHTPFPLSDPPIAVSCAQQ